MDPDRADTYDYEHPPEAIAQVPADERAQARLLSVRRGFAEQGDGAPADDDLVDARVADVGRWLRAGDLLVVNDVRVAPARLSGSRDTGGRLSVLVVSTAGRSATVLLGTRGRLQAGEVVEVAGDHWRLMADLGQGRWTIDVAQGDDVETLMERAGRMPLPPYIERGKVDDERDGLDRERYQTTFAHDAEQAAEVGRAAAAPTAGLHFTPELFAELESAGVGVARVALEVGEGTFRPLRGETLDEHVMHEERYVVPDEVSERVAATRAAGGRIVAVGTTVVRTLESAADADGIPRPGAAATRMFIRPGHEFATVDALLTNFHQPRSTLMVLVSAFAGTATIRAAYDHALASGYRFLSYGDAMLLHGEAPDSRA
jgi:S-adenosylmethionine:tRNA ribosyltransferase-isomerase